MAMNSSSECCHSLLQSRDRVVEDCVSQGSKTLRKSSIYRQQGTMYALCSISVPFCRTAVDSYYTGLFSKERRHTFIQKL